MKLEPKLKNMAEIIVRIRIYTKFVYYILWKLEKCVEFLYDMPVTDIKFSSENLDISIS